MINAPTKPVWLSKTVIASALMLAGSLYGLGIDYQSASDAAGYVDSIVTALLSLIAIYGRVTATRTLTLSPKPGKEDPS